MANKSKSKVKHKAKPKPVKKAKSKPAKVSSKPKAKAQSKAKAKPAVKSVVKTQSKVAQKTKVVVQKKAPAKAKVVKKPAVKPTVATGRKPEPKISAKAGSTSEKTVIKTPQVNEKKMSTPKGKENGFKLRYNDKELVEFKTIIIGKLSEAKKDLDLLRSSMSHTDDHGTDDTSPTFKLMEDGSDVLTKEETAQLAARQQKFIKHLEDALVRIENKSYGICRATGNLIPKERLRIVPHATLSIEAKQKQF